MGMQSGRLDYWRNFFSNSDIFDVIENGIRIAASDCPTEFHNRRAQIAEMLFSCRMARCFGCNHVELQVPEQEDEDEEFRREVEGVVSDEGGEKESKVNTSSGVAVGMAQRMSNYSYDEAETLTEEIEEECQTIGEVFRIKGILANRNDESDSVLFESLRRLQLMGLSVETLKATEIGKAVNGLRKHNSNQIRHLVRTLIEGWKVLVDDWVAAAPVLEEATPESMNPSSYDLDTDGLPSPPLDEGAFLATQTTSIEFSKFFEGMDEDGNPRAIGEFNKNKSTGRKPTLDNQNILMRNQPTYPSSLSKEKVSVRTQDDFIKQKWQHEVQDKQSKLQASNVRHSKTEESFYKPPKLNVGNSGPSGSGPERNPNLSNTNKTNNGIKSQRQLVPAEVQKRPTTALQDKSKNSDDNLVRAKLEAAKRKLQERYQEAENVKKQRTIQVMELHDLPKQGLNRKPFHPKQGNFARHWSNGRR